MSFDDFDKGLDLKHTGKYNEALQYFNKVKRKTDNIDLDLLFNIGECSLKVGDITTARKMMKKVVEIDDKDYDAQNILKKINKKWLNRFKETDFNKDGVIIDANFLIDYYDIYGYQKFIRFIKKTRSRYNIYTTVRIYNELNEIGKFSDFYDKTQNIIKESINIINIQDNIINDLEKIILDGFPDATEIRDSHNGRDTAWKNDLSLICLLNTIRNPIKYIVTNDSDLEKIIRYLFPNKPDKYFLRENKEFITLVNLFSKTKEKTQWEKDLYKK
jgi:tetratricopeptide (TPR) repeat protein